MSRTKLVLLGTGTPIMAPNRYQSSLAIIVDDQPYIVDCGSGILQRLSDARAKGISALANENLNKLFITHFHPDHTLGLPGFLISPWNMQRTGPIEIYGPEGIDTMVNGLLEVYADGINEHLYDGPKQLDPIQTKVEQIEPGVFYQDDKISVESIPVIHGSFEAYAFKFTTPDKTIVVSGDTCPVPLLYEKAKNCDILVHEVFCESAMPQMPKKYQDYFYKVHTGAIELGKIAKAVNPKLLVLTHQIFYNLSKDEIIKEIRQNYDGALAYGDDLDVFD